MVSRVLAVMCAVAGVAYAFGPRSPSGDAAGATKASVVAEQQRLVAAGAPAVQGALTVTSGQPMHFTLRVTNRGPKVIELRFADGQTHDFSLRDASDREVWRWSADRMFTQAMRTRALGSNEQVDFSEDGATGLKAGAYTLVAELKASNHPLRLTQGVTIP